MKRLTLIFITITSISIGQTSLSLDSCIRMAKRNYPLIKQSNLIDENEKNNIQSDTKNWLPKLSFVSKASYQSEVVEFLGKSFPHDSYLAALDLEQTLFDGGQVHQQKQLDKISGETESLKNEVELYKLIDRIDQLFSSILLTRESIKTLNIYMEDISNKKMIISASVKNGILLQSNLDALEAEEFKSEQSLIEGKENLNSLYLTLGMFIGKSVDDNTELAMDPIMNTSKSDEITRPEIKLFDSQKALFEARHKLTNKNALPKIAVSGEGAYGRPGPN
ncbi:MAG: TolC family protein, partial [Bacteroidetes bacterium]|nr:TolC family protein [Bacteroidota bacterium]